MSTFLKRYEAGDRIAVWHDLVLLGEEVRHKRYYADAVAVATETMRRARQNVELLVRRLDQMGYCFVTMEVRDRCEARAQNVFLAGRTRLALKLHPGNTIIPMTSAELRSGVQATAVKSARKVSAGKPPLQNRDILDRPTKRSLQLLDRLEKMVDGPLPLSLRAWYEQVGGVSLLGYPSTLQFDINMNAGAGDPLMINSLHPVLEMMDDGWDEREDSPWWHNGKVRFPLAPDRVFKAGGAGGDPYSMAIPSACADGIFEDGNKRTFVDYLRNAFAWGGFPGWKDKRKQTREIVANLAEGMLSL